MLGRAMRYFHANPLFIHQSLPEDVLTFHAPEHPQDQLRAFNMQVDLQSSSLADTAQWWTAIGTPQVPAALYQVRVQSLATEDPYSGAPILERRGTHSPSSGE